MENCKTDNIEANENINIQCDCDRDRVGGRVGERRPAQPSPCVQDRNQLAGAGGIDSSLLFFFLLLVVIVCQSDCGIELDTLLWFFLLLVVILCSKCGCEF
ncbi:MAG TPA: hypothetical protein DCM73_00655 [Clostridiales bacterium]|nr:hypothetical protein [Clostridiales bacterium]